MAAMTAPKADPLVLLLTSEAMQENKSLSHAAAQRIARRQVSAVREAIKRGELQG